MTNTARVVAVAVVLCGLGRVFYATGPPPAHTGGFGEETCATCHFENPVNDPGGALSWKGVPDSYSPGKSYEIEVVLVRPGLKRGGFQASARFADGSDSGKQAGAFAVEAERMKVDRQNDVEYARHTYAGSEPASPDSIRWPLTWAAPDSAAGPVVFHVAANAANGDDSEFGDFIYVMEATSAADQ